MSASPPDTQAEWRRLLTTEHAFAPGRNAFRRIPSPPRCKLCNAPFAGPGGLVFRRFGYAPWPKNPRMCQACIRSFQRLGPGGAEIPASFLFADVRGSTGLAERMSPADFGALLTRFYDIGSRAIIETDGIVDKFVGDEVVGLYIPVFAGAGHAAAAIRAARKMRDATRSHGDGAWLPVGIGVHTGQAFIGVVGSADEVTDFTALGDAVNTAARLASSAAGGEILISDEAAAASRIALGGLARRDLSLRGRSASVVVWADTIE